MPFGFPSEQAFSFTGIPKRRGFFCARQMGLRPLDGNHFLCNAHISYTANMGPNFVFHGCETWPHAARGAALSEGGPVAGGCRAVTHVGI